ncbi:hypothetical protein [Bacillus sp. E(2018)]|uniref:hypothetical protein n=1 Tax=Bacillus sp. E(2018) TaxID=2502239 RepID=UPI00336A002D
MTEKMSKEQRSKNMQTIKSQSKLENMVSRELWKRGIRFRKNVRNLFGKPDIAIKNIELLFLLILAFGMDVLFMAISQKLTKNTGIKNYKEIKQET